VTISKRFTLIAFLFFALVFLIENLNNAYHANDFKVYYEASQEFLHGGNPYGQAYGLSSGFYKYSPSSLLFFAPATLFTFEIAKIIHFVFIAFLFIGSLHLGLFFAKKKLPDFKFNETLYLSLVLIFSAVHMSRELHLGNINFLLIFLTLISFYLIQENKKGLASVSLSVLFLLKPYFLIIVLVLLVSREFALILKTVLVSAVFTLLPVLFIGISKTIELNQNWLTAMSLHSEGMLSEHTFSSIIKNYSGLQLAGYWQYIFIALIAFVFLSLRISYFNKVKIYTPELIISDVFILVALIPNLVITDSQHFLFSIPMLCLILIHLFINPSKVIIVLFSILFFFYGMNSNDLLGNPLSNTLDTYSTIGVSNLLLVLLFLYLKKGNGVISS